MKYILINGFKSRLHKASQNPFKNSKFFRQSYQTRKKILNKLINHHNQKKKPGTIEQTKKHFLNFLFGENSRWINIFHNLFCDSMIMMMMMVVVVFKILDFCFWSKTKSWTLESVFGLHFSFYFFVYLSNSFNIQFKRKKQNWKQESFLGIIFSEFFFSSWKKFSIFWSVELNWNSYFFAFLILSWWFSVGGGCVCFLAFFCYQPNHFSLN